MGLSEETISLWVFMDFCIKCVDDVVDFKEENGQLTSIQVKWKNGGGISWIKLRHLTSLHKPFLRL